jgi:Ca2+-binding RTX toxin-like protein
MLLFERDRHSGDRRRTSGRRQFVAAVEGMEDRKLLTGSGAAIVLTGTTLEVFGTNLGDTGSVGLNNGSVEVQLSNSAGSDDVSFPTSQVGLIEFFGGSGNNTFSNNTPLTGYLFGGSGDNVLNGGSGSDFLFATSGGTNFLNAGSGSEVLEAVGPGTNTLNGGSGYDTMITFAGNNHVIGGTGSSFIVALGGQNTIDGGPGNSFVYSFSSTDVIHPTQGTTVIHIGY